MVDRTDRHFRWLFRRLTSRALLYTPMLVARSLLERGANRLLRHDPMEQPIAVQLAGSRPNEVAEAARIAACEGAAEINLNCGCPSSTASHATWGAALMAHPKTVAEIITAVKSKTSLPVTVKHRLGLGDGWDEQRLFAFVDTLAAAGCDRFIVHARDAILGGMSTSNNRKIPPLRHDQVLRLVKNRRELAFVSNGGFTELEHVRSYLDATPELAGVMVGRAAYDRPWAFARADSLLWGAEDPAPTRRSVGEQWLEYVRREVSCGSDPHLVTRHGLGLWHGVPGARQARIWITEEPHAADFVDRLARAVALLP